MSTPTDPQQIAALRESAFNAQDWNRHATFGRYTAWSNESIAAYRRATPPDVILALLDEHEALVARVAVLEDVPQVAYQVGLRLVELMAS